MFEGAISRKLLNRLLIEMIVEELNLLKNEETNVKECLRNAIHLIGLLGLLIGGGLGCGCGSPVALIPSQTTPSITHIQTLDSIRNKWTSASLLKKKKEMVLNDSIQNEYSPIQKTLIVTQDKAQIFSSPYSKKVIQCIALNSGLTAIGKRIINGESWYLVKALNNQQGWISSEVTDVLPDPSVLINAPLINQMPGLARGCEVTSLAMLIGQAGKKVSKLELAKQINKVPFESEGYRGNPNDGFVGNIYTFEKPGLGVYHGPIAALAKAYLGDRVIDLTGDSWPSIQKQLDSGHAVWVITNSTFKPLPDDDPYWYTWTTKEGTIRVTYREHSVLITGYGPDSIYINDPLSPVKNNKVDRSNFITAWKQLGSQAVSYR